MSKMQHCFLSGQIKGEKKNFKFYKKNWQVALNKYRKECEQMKRVAKEIYLKNVGPLCLKTRNATFNEKRI